MPPAADLLRAALAAPLGPHPAADTLRQYAAGTLAPAQQHQVEAHALDCPRCADVLAGLAQTDATATDQALAALRHRLHARVAAEAAPRPAAAPWHWPRLAAAATVVAGLMGGGLWEWQHRTAPAAEVATVAAPPAAAESSAAVPDGAPVLPPAAATAPATSAPTVATAPAKPRPGAVVAYEPRRRAAKKLVLPNADREEVVAMSSSAADGVAAARAPAPAAMMATASQTAADSVAAPLNEVAMSPARLAAPAARVLMGRVAGVAVVPAMPTESTAVAQRMTLVAPANSAVVDAMPAAPSLAPAPVGGLGPLRDRLRREAAEFVPDEAPLKGSVRVRFTVGNDGKFSDLKVVRGLRADYDAEALRLVCEGPNWVPGVAGGRRTALPVELDVAF